MHSIKKTAYTGSLAINVRNLSEAMSTFSLTSREPMSITELSNLLQLLESFVMSSNIYYDGTLPPQDLINTNTILDTLKKSDDFQSLKVQISPISFTTNSKILTVCKDSIEQAFSLIKEIKNETHVDKFSSDIEKFVSYFKRDDYRYEDRYSDALSIVEDVMSAKETFRGSKCLAGILIGQVDEEYVYEYVKELFKNSRNDDSTRDLIAKLIDRFRVNYISEQASLKQAAYLANPAIENLRSQQTFLFWQYTMKKVSKSLIDKQNIQNISESSRQIFETFPVGLSVLMNTPGRRPEALFETANLMKDSIFNKIMTAETPNERNIHSFSDEQFMDIQESIFIDRFNKYDSMSKFKRLAFKGTRSVLLKGVGSLLSSGFDLFSMLSNELPIIEMFDKLQVPESVSSIGESYFSDILGELNAYQIGIIAKINQDKYHDYMSKNKRNLENALDDIENAQAISNKVEKLFGRSLVQ